MSEMLIKFVIGVIILLLSTQILVGLAEKISRVLRISPLIIGITIVAIGTSLPELAVSIVSILKNDAGLAMGNIIGSNIINILLVFPVGVFLGKLRIGTTKTQENALILLGVTAVFFITQFSGTAKTISGLFLIALAVLVSFVEYKLGINGRTHEDIKRFKSQTKEKMGPSVLFVGILLIAGIIGGSVLVVDSIKSISTATGISTTILGLTLTAIATSLPELLATIFSQRDKQEKTTIGNILGSNIYNLLLIGGVVSLFPLTAAIQTKEWIWLALTTAGFVFTLKHYKGKTPPKRFGIILIILLLIYLLSQ